MLNVSVKQHLGSHTAMDKCKDNDDDDDDGGWMARCMMMEVMLRLGLGF
jgi:hypothetical protein